MSYDPLVSYIAEYISLNEKEIEILKSLTRIKKVRKRQFVVEQGEVCRYENYVIEGCLRCYHLDENGREHIVQFGVEDWWIADLRSFHARHLHVVSL